MESTEIRLTRLEKDCERVRDDQKRDHLLLKNEQEKVWTKLDKAIDAIENLNDNFNQLKWTAVGAVGILVAEQLGLMTVVGNMLGIM